MESAARDAAELARRLALGDSSGLRLGGEELLAKLQRYLEEAVAVRGPGGLRRGGGVVGDRAVPGYWAGGGRGRALNCGWVASTASAPGALQGL